MTEQSIYEHLKQRASVLKYCNYKIAYKDYIIRPDATLEVASFNQYHYILVADSGLSVSSDVGEYNKENPLLDENIHEHTGIIVIRNYTGSNKNIQFVQLTLIN